MNKVVPLVNTLLLAAILIVSVRIFQRMPVTLADIRNAKPEERKTLLLRRTFVHIHDPIDVNVSNASFEVEVTNTPLAVEIER